jgi:hypothetical protein
MGRFKIEVDWGENAAFQDADWRFEMADIFNSLAMKVEDMGSDDTNHKSWIRDSNGNRVGTFEIDFSEEGYDEKH